MCLDVWFAICYDKKMKSSISYFVTNVNFIYKKNLKFE